MKKYIQILIFLLSSFSFSQISGTWYWDFGNYKHSMELDLELVGTELKGYHCSSFYDGNKIDCIENNNLLDDCSLLLTQVSLNVYQGTIKSGFSDTEGVVKITYSAVTDEILFEVIQDPLGEFYLPNNVTLNKTP